MKKLARVIAFYLPQFHPIPENDQWWGPGFTEWTNVGKAVGYFPNHYQPRVPADLGYYDLRNPESRIAQAEMAASYGVEGFCYWHYWFGDGKRLLERPFSEVLSSGSPDFPFCLGWANESWRGFAHGLTPRKVLIEQKYPGIKDIEKHFESVLPALKDARYIRVDSKPLFFIYRPFDNPEQISNLIQIWQNLARQNGLNGIYFVAQKTLSDNNDEIFRMGFDGIYPVRITAFLSQNKSSLMSRWGGRITRRFKDVPNVSFYREAMRHFLSEEMKEERIYPGIYPNWDHSPRTGKKGVIIHESTPELFEQHAREALAMVVNKPFDQRIIFLKSWNEWAEGNYIEPDIRFGRRYLDALKRTFTTS